MPSLLSTCFNRPGDFRLLKTPRQHRKPRTAEAGLLLCIAPQDAAARDTGLAVFGG